jgi:hypothetical protein
MLSFGHHGGSLRAAGPDVPEAHRDVLVEGPSGSKMVPDNLVPLGE